MDKDGGNCVALARKLAKVVAVNGEDFSGLLCDRIAGRGRQSRERKNAADISGAPVDDLLGTGAAVDRKRKMAREHDEQAFDDDTLVGKNFAGLKPAQLSVRDEPCQFFARRGGERLVFGQAINQVHCAAPVRRGVGEQVG